MPKAKSFRFLVLGLSVCLLGWSCRTSGEKPDQQTQKRDESGQRPAPKPVPVAVDLVKKGTASSVYITTATLEAEQSAQITARTTGVVRELFQEEGDYVENGRILLNLENDEQKLALKEQRLHLKRLRNEFERQLKIKEAGLLSPQEFDLTENDLNLAEAALEKAELALSYTQIRAPFSGHIVRRYLDLGNQVQPGTPLFDLLDMDPLLMKVHIPANRIGTLKVGQTLHLKLDSSQAELEGRVDLVSPIVDPETGTVKITAKIERYPAGTRPGDFAEVRVITDRHEDALLVPSIAVFEEQGKQILYTVVDGNSKKCVVKVGFVESDVTEILEGVAEGDWVVVKGQRNLRENLPLEIMQKPKETLSMDRPTQKAEVTL